MNRVITNVIDDDDILIVNLGQKPLPYVSHGKYTFSPSGAKAVLIKGIDFKRQIIATLAVTMTGKLATSPSYL